MPGYEILAVGWTNIQPREGGLEKQKVGKPRDHFMFSYLLPALGVGGAQKKELALLMVRQSYLGGSNILREEPVSTFGGIILILCSIPNESIFRPVIA